MELIDVAAAADALGLPVTRVHQLVRDGRLVAVPRGNGAGGGGAGGGGGKAIPADFIQDGDVVKSLPAVITQLRDARFADAEIIDWLYREDDSLPGSPIEALRANRGTEVKRRAQVAGY